MIYGNEIDQIDYFHSNKRRKRFLYQNVCGHVMNYVLFLIQKRHLTKRRNKNLLNYKEGNIKQYSMIIFNGRKSRLYIDQPFQTHYHSLIKPSQLYSDYNEQTCYNQFYMRYGR